MVVQQTPDSIVLEGTLTVTDFSHSVTIIFTTKGHKNKMHKNRNIQKICNYDDSKYTISDSSIFLEYP